jgi:hypothetical protein
MRLSLIPLFRVALITSAFGFSGVRQTARGLISPSDCAGASIAIENMRVHFALDARWMQEQMRWSCPITAADSLMALHRLSECCPKF